MKIELSKIWLDDYNGRKSFRADFSNDRHFEVVIGWPHEAGQVAAALLGLASMIGRDPHLKPTRDAPNEEGLSKSTQIR
jgi:hypothetical protein